jgi:hypothetical protein
MMMKIGEGLLMNVNVSRLIAVFDVIVQRVDTRRTSKRCMCHVLGSLSSSSSCSQNEILLVLIVMRSPRQLSNKRGETRRNSKVPVCSVRLRGSYLYCLRLFI